MPTNALNEFFTIAMEAPENSSYTTFKRLIAVHDKLKESMSKDLKLKQAYYQAFEQVFQARLPKEHEEVKKAFDLPCEICPLSSDERKICQERRDSDCTKLFEAYELKARHLLERLEKGASIKEITPDAFDSTTAAAITFESNAFQLTKPLFSSAKHSQELLAENAREASEQISKLKEGQRMVIEVYKNGFKLYAYDNARQWDDELIVADSFKSTDLQSILTKLQADEFKSFKTTAMPVISDVERQKARDAMQSNDLKKASASLEKLRSEFLAKFQKNETNFLIDNAEVALFESLAPEIVNFKATTFEESIVPVKKEVQNILEGKSQIPLEEEHVISFSIKKRKAGALEVSALKGWRESKGDLKSAIILKSQDELQDKLQELFKQEKAAAIIELYSNAFRLRDYTNADIELEEFEKFKPLQSISQFSKAFLDPFTKKEEKIPEIARECRECKKPTTSHLMDNKYYLCHSCFIKQQKT